MSASRSIRLLLACAAAAAALGLGGCAGNGGHVTRTNFVAFTPEQQEEIAQRAGHEYRIQAGDVLRIAFPYEEKLDQDNVLVLNDGSVQLIGVDRVVVGGLTMTEADSVITAAYAQDYRDPDLSVLMFKSRGQRVYVLGEVRSPGYYDVPPEGLGIVGAVALAGGFADNAAKEGTVLVRITREGYLCQEVDLSNFTDVKSFELASVRLEPFDVIYVPRSRQGDFEVFTRSVLIGLASVTRIASDIRYLSDSQFGRY